MAADSILITGTGLVSCLGNLRQTWQNLLNLGSGKRIPVGGRIKSQQIFPNLPALPLALIGQRPITLDYLTQLVVWETLEDARLTPPLEDCGVVVGSSRGCQASWEQFRANPENSTAPHWLATLPSQPAQLTARIIGSRGPALAPMAACATGIWAIAQGCQLIQQGTCQRVVVGAVEAPITPLTLAGFDRIAALGKKGCFPFDTHREGFVLGEGAAMMVLEAAESALSRQANIYGQILGFAMSCDAAEMAAPEADGKTAIWAVERCLERAGLHPPAIDYIHAHGTGTILNDAREANIIQNLFPNGVAVSSTKGATGHALGASGAIAAALSLMAIEAQKLPPNIGLQHSEFDLNLVTSPRQVALNNLLCFSFGFGGQNAVLALGKYWQ